MHYFLNLYHLRDIRHHYKEFKMSFTLTELELQSYNLTFWLESDVVEFGRWEFDTLNCQFHTVFSNKVRFHKPAQNKCDPIEFVLKSSAKVLDGVRGPIRPQHLTVELKYEEVVAQVRVLLKSLRMNPRALYETQFVEHPFVKITQTAFEAFYLTDLTTNQVKSVTGLPAVNWELILNVAKDLTKGLPVELPKTRPEKSWVLLENEQYRLSYYRVGAC